MAKAVALYAGSQCRLRCDREKYQGHPNNHMIKTYIAVRFNPITCISVVK